MSLGPGGAGSSLPGPAHRLRGRGSRPGSSGSSLLACHAHAPAMQALGPGRCGTPLAGHRPPPASAWCSPCQKGSADALRHG
eukprot:30200-Pelagomonas_calceolata.AAC.1